MDHDVVILGGGPAGLAAALIAGRARLATVLVSEGKARNLVTTASHGFLTRDGAHPSELAAVGLAQLEKYPTVQTALHAASAVESINGGFVVTDETGARWRTRRVVIATGYRDVLASLSLPGIEDVYGKTVYPCPFCDGFEHADERLGVFMGEGAEHFVQVVRMWSDDVIVFTNGHALSEGARGELQARGVLFEEEPIARLVSRNGVLKEVELQGGRRIARDAGFVGDDFSVEATSFARELGVTRTTNDWGMDVLDAGDDGRTNIDGVFVVGDAKSGFGGIMAAASQGSACAESIVHEIAAARWRDGANNPAA